MEKKVGDKRRFSFSDKEYIIKEILDNPNISMWWTWTSGICPHCKRRIERTIQHKFYRIEILADATKKDNEITIKDIQILGDTLDNRRMLIPIDDKAFKQALLLSKKFKKFAEVL